MSVIDLDSGKVFSSDNEIIGYCYVLQTGIKHFPDGSLEHKIGFRIATSYEGIYSIKYTDKAIGFNTSDLNLILYIDNDYKNEWLRIRIDTKFIHGYKKKGSEITIDFLDENQLQEEWHKENVDWLTKQNQ